MFKNTASQKLTVIAIADASHASLDAGEVVTGDSANITCKVEQDNDGTRTAIADTNPTETEGGHYDFDLTAAETNGDVLNFYPTSSTAGVQVFVVGGNVIYTRSATPDVNVVQISGDSTAADNVEADYDGTGYNKSASTIGTCTTNTDMRGTDSAFLATSAPTNFSALLINGSGHITRVTTVDTTTANTDMRGTDSAFLATSAPTNFGSLGINVSGHIERVTLVDTTTTNTDMRGTDGANTTTPPTVAAMRTEMETEGSKLDHLWEMTEDDGGTRRYTTNALEQAPGGGGGGSATIENQTTIINSVNAIQTSLAAASTINVTSTVASGGEVTLHIGSDYRVRQSTSIDIPVTDVGGALRDKLQDSAQVETVIFGAGRMQGANAIVGTVDPSDITYASDVSTIKVEVTATQLSAATAFDDYQYHIKAIAPVESGESVGDEEIIVEGCLTLKPERAYPST